MKEFLKDMLPELFGPILIEFHTLLLLMPKWLLIFLIIAGLCLVILAIIGLGTLYTYLLEKSGKKSKDADL
jgi:hypothetical protein